MLSGGEELGIHRCCTGRVGVHLVGVVIVGVLRECKGRKWTARAETLTVRPESGEPITVAVVRGRTSGGVRRCAVPRRIQVSVHIGNG